MVFKKEIGEHYDELIECGKYQPYRRFGQLNPDFDAYSRILLDLKDGKPSIVEHFRGHLDSFLETGIPITYIPSHDPAKTSSGLRLLAQALARTGRVDATSCLVRSVKIDKLATGGDRSISVHLSSIIVCDPHLIAGKDVLLLDDITTTGNSLEACKQLLLRAGAGRVQKLALGKTA